MMSKRLLLSLMVLLSILMIESTAYAFLAGYSHRKEITIQSANIDSDLTDFPVYIRINADTDIGGNMKDTSTTLSYGMGNAATNRWNSCGLISTVTRTATSGGTSRGRAGYGVVAGF